MEVETVSPRVLILGAGVNGASVARELAINGVSTWVVDAHDIAYGASSKSSRLIHGGLRYLEYGEFSLVRESLAERERLRRLAPHFVSPLRLFIPVAHRGSGFISSGLKFLGASRSSTWQKWAKRFQSQRGLWLVRAGLAMYDRFAASRQFPPHAVTSVGAPGSPAVCSRKFRWLCAYSDAQMWAPERFAVALLQDARQAANESGIDFRVVTHAKTEWRDGRLSVTTLKTDAAGMRDVCAHLTPEIVVNATGAWGDRTLAGLRIESPPLFGGTKGSHFITWNRDLMTALQGQAVYAEADDGRLVFVLPHQDAVLVGTTDERFEGPPDEAVATPEELDYLVSLVNELFSDVALTRADVAVHYSGVRPLPRQQGAASSVSRDHAVATQDVDGVRLMTLVGGKLTTCRAFGEQVADDAMNRLGVTRRHSTRDRIVPGGEDYPATPAAVARRTQSLSQEFDLPAAAAQEAFSLFGARAGDVLKEALCGSNARERQMMRGTHLARGVVRWIIRSEWVTSVEDLIERRLMLVFRRELTNDTLRDLTELVAEEHGDGGRSIEDEVSSLEARLERHYGRVFSEDASAARPRNTDVRAGK